MKNKLNTILLLIINTFVITNFIFLFTNYRNIKSIPINSLYSQVFDNLPTPALIKDRDSNIIAMNEEFMCILDILGIDRDIIGTRGQAFGEKALEKFIAHDQMAMNKGSLIVFEEELEGYAKIKSSKLPLLNSIGSPIGVLITFTIEERY